MALWRLPQQCGVAVTFALGAERNYPACALNDDQRRKEHVAPTDSMPEDATTNPFMLDHA
jgi:hypothetical protein